MTKKTKEKNALTDKQQELFIWIKEYIKENTYSPSVREMIEPMGLASPAPVQCRLNQLRKKGYITWKENHSRTIKIL